jgi:serine/threonine-protein kinase HipA
MLICYELWKRIVFNICVKNTDDHLRNHGFMLGKNGWKLSLAFDINPVPTGTGLTLNISDDDNSLNTELAYGSG